MKKIGVGRVVRQLRHLNGSSLNSRDSICTAIEQFHFTSSRNSEVYYWFEEVALTRKNPVTFGKKKDLSINVFTAH